MLDLTARDQTEGVPTGLRVWKQRKLKPVLKGRWGKTFFLSNESNLGCTEGMAPCPTSSGPESHATTLWRGHWIYTTIISSLCISPSCQLLLREEKFFSCVYQPQAQSWQPILLRRKKKSALVCPSAHAQPNHAWHRCDSWKELSRAHSQSQSCFHEVWSPSPAVWMLCLSYRNILISPQLPNKTKLWTESFHLLRRAGNGSLPEFSVG